MNQYYDATREFPPFKRSKEAPKNHLNKGRSSKLRVHHLYYRTKVE